MDRMCFESIPVKGKEAWEFTHQLPPLIRRRSLLGSSLPGTSGREQQEAMSIYKNCLQVTSRMGYGAVCDTGSICYSQSSCSLLYAQYLLRLQVYSRHSIIFVE